MIALGDTPYKFRLQHFLNKLHKANLRRHSHIKYLYGYVGMKKPATFECLKCHKKFILQARLAIRYKKVCPYEYPRHHRWTTVQIGMWLFKHTNGEYRLKSRYINTHTKILIEHHSKNCLYYKKYHKYYRYYVKWDSFLYLHNRCPKDKCIKESKIQSMGINKLRKRVKKITNGSYIVLSNHYKGLKHKLLFEHHLKKCLYYQKHHKYGKFWMTPDNFLYQKNRCPYETSLRERKGQTFTLKQAQQVVDKQPDSENYIILSYTNANAPALFEHRSKDCPYYKKYHKYCIFKASLNCFVFSNTRCPYTHRYKGEIISEYWVEKHGLKRNIAYIHAYRFKKHPFTTFPQHADIYLPHLCWNKHYDTGIDIEFNGLQHFKEVDWSGHMTKKQLRHGLQSNVLRDIYKAVYCKYNHILLIPINYIFRKINITLIKQIVNKALNSRLLPIISMNQEINFFTNRLLILGVSNIKNSL